MATTVNRTFWSDPELSKFSPLPRVNFGTSVMTVLPESSSFLRCP